MEKSAKKARKIEQQSNPRAPAPKKQKSEHNPGSMTKASLVKVYPPTQQREINVVRGMVNDVRGYLEKLSNPEGFDAMSTVKIAAIADKIDKKMKSPQMVSLLAPNEAPPGQSETLESQGRGLKDALLQCSAQLSALSDVVRSVASTRPEALESSPLYLKNATSALSASGVDCPPFVVANISKMFCMQASEEGSYPKVLQYLNPDDSIDGSLKQISASPAAVIAAIQADIFTQVVWGFANVGLVPEQLAQSCLAH